MRWQYQAKAEPPLQPPTPDKWQPNAASPVRKKAGVLAAIVAGAFFFNPEPITAAEDVTLDKWEPRLSQPYPAKLYPSVAQSATVDKPAHAIDWYRPIVQPYPSRRKLPPTEFAFVGEPADVASIPPVESWHGQLSQPYVGKRQTASYQFVEPLEHELRIPSFDWAPQIEQPYPAKRYPSVAQAATVDKPAHPIDWYMPVVGPYPAKPKLPPTVFSFVAEPTVFAPPVPAVDGWHGQISQPYRTKRAPTHSQYVEPLESGLREATLDGWFREIVQPYPAKRYPIVHLTATVDKAAHAIDWYVPIVQPQFHVRPVVSGYSFVEVVETPTVALDWLPSAPDQFQRLRLVESLFVSGRELEQAVSLDWLSSAPDPVRRGRVAGFLYTSVVEPIPDTSKIGSWFPQSHGIAWRLRRVAEYPHLFLVEVTIPNDWRPELGQAPHRMGSAAAFQFVSNVEPIALAPVPSLDSWFREVVQPYLRRIHPTHTMFTHDTTTPAPPAPPVVDRNYHEIGSVMKSAGRRGSSRTYNRIGRK